MLASSWHLWGWKFDCNAKAEIHDGLDLSGGDSGDDDLFGIFSVKFSTDGREIVAAGSADAIYIYDLVANRPALKIHAHEVC
ncbi:hypothetical protein Ancab_025452 [Ancistrocladus abbreviatus]